MPRNQITRRSELEGWKGWGVSGAAIVLQASGFMTAARSPTARGDGRDNREWDALMAAAQAGDAAAYRRLLSEGAVWLRSYYARRLPPAMIDDAIQDTLIALTIRTGRLAPGWPRLHATNGSMFCGRWKTSPRTFWTMTSPYPAMKKQS